MFISVINTGDDTSDPKFAIELFDNEGTELLKLINLKTGNSTVIDPDKWCELNGPVLYLSDTSEQGASWFRGDMTGLVVQV